ncbi:MAG: spermidine synthase [Planctomycetes bacterium]|nr:spermidine synthase [Planctomycetota bacterium]
MAPGAFEELDYGMTPLGELILRRREVPSLGGIEVFEVKLNGQFLMSSLVTDTEIELANLALPLLTGTECDVLVGGLGLGYTAQAALDARNVRSVTVIEYLARVMDWHRRGLVPLAAPLTDDPRCSLIQGDFFALIDRPTTNHDQERPGGDALPTPFDSNRFHAILLDIDHSPQCLLQPSHAAFYTPKGLRRLTGRLHPGGVFALWSADPPQSAFVDDLESVFSSVQIHESKFYNPLLNEDDVNYIFVARLE